jgi:hypothetical protein
MRILGEIYVFNKLVFDDRLPVLYPCYKVFEYYKGKGKKPYGENTEITHPFS